MKPVQIGITGGIGSGKTLVCEVMKLQEYLFTTPMQKQRNYLNLMN
jgi:dephospho-CoA kinase